MNQPALPLSVLMPVYNAGRHLAPAVRSVLNQSFGDFEFIIIDDGSTDGSLAVLRRFEADDPRVRVVSRENRGLVASLNQMIGLARGEFLARMDADDLCLPDRFLRQVDFLREHPEVACVGGSIREIDDQGRLLVSFPAITSNEEIQEALLSGTTAIAHPAAMMRREALLAAGGYRPEFYPVEDLDLWLRLGEAGELANLADPVLEYRVHDASICSRSQGIQVERARLACEEAFRRRGIEPRPFRMAAFRPGEGRASRHEFWLKYGWWAFQAGRRSAALRFSLRSIGWLPWRPDGWRLLACALVKPMPTAARGGNPS
jgi:glycosyltransferase involved in cell wall biosynthesis